MIELRSTSRGVRIGLWIAAVVLMFAAAAYQRLTGPTVRLRGGFEVAGATYRYRLIRSASSTSDARVAIPQPAVAVAGQLHYKRYGTTDEFSAVPLVEQDGQLAGDLPAQPAAGKLEYYITLDGRDGSVRIPARDGTVILRFKDQVPPWVLLPHVAMMFVAVLVGMRAGLGALFAPVGVGPLVWTTLGFMTVGGMILGPIVQKLAFGALWTGIPFGYDLTDNKTLIMWLVWVVAAVVLTRFWREEQPGGRAVVLLAAVVMTAVYLIPHSLRGSELDYGQVDRGVAPSEAVETGR